MKIWLLRHGEAELTARRDADRVLTAYGRQQVSEIAAHLRGQPLSTVLCSPYVRARQTADIVLDALGPMVIRWLCLGWYQMSWQAVVRQLDSLAKGDLLLVSHQPLLGLLGAGYAKAIRRALPLGTASLACLEGDFAVAG